MHLAATPAAQGSALLRRVAQHQRRVIAGGKDGVNGSGLFAYDPPALVTVMPNTPDARGASVVLQVVVFLATLWWFIRSTR